MSKTADAPAALTHVDRSGAPRMVDIAAKVPTAREATARAFVTVSARARRLVRAGATKKGDPLHVARTAGLMAAKRTADLIPLCHPLPLTGVDLDIHSRRRGYEIRATVRTTAATGVEMEALTAVSVAALTIYDMLKAVDRDMVIDGICLLEKKGGRSGHYRRGGR
jgi:cyclic pyranopterin monophosphate synthase